MKVYLVRHGESVPREGLTPLQAREAALSVWGKAQARAAARFLKGKHIESIISSPYARAKETAEFISLTCGVPLRLDERLCEWEPVHDLEGKAFAALVQSLRARETAARSVEETYEQALSRVGAVLDEQRKTNSQEAVCIVAHELILQNLLMGLTNERQSLALASISCVEYAGGTWRLVFVNKKLQFFTRALRRLRRYF